MDNATPKEFEARKKNASYGALLSIIIILAIVVIGAFYSWGKRIEENKTPIVLPDATTTELGS